MPTAPHSLLTLIKEMPIVNPPADKARSPKRQDLGRYCAAVGVEKVEILRRCTMMK